MGVQRVLCLPPASYLAPRSPPPLPPAAGRGGECVQLSEAPLVAAL